ncbi:CRAL-TRIO domain-containing protein [Tribonema minus]|uniref:CRAL-TRIO domain-containing protein n=1 Tax=Tribonema minus TaxID=303371 RepID=A0A835ZL56_9STRA|nr:CRAL-TRIO domain-containing protein [Tribonema minus]
MLVRFIEGAFWNLEHKGVPVSALIEETVAWRESVGAHAITPASLGARARGRDIVGPLAPALRAGAIVVHGRDRDGRPIMHVRLGALFGKGYSAEQCLRYAVYTVERAWRARARGVEAYTIVADCRGFGLTHLPPLPFLRAMFGMLSRHYPMRLGHILLCNASASVHLCWRVCSPIVPPRTKDKIVFAREGDRALVARYVAPAELPRALGGASAYEYDAARYFAEAHA